MGAVEELVSALIEPEPRLTVNLKRMKTEIILEIFLAVFVQDEEINMMGRSRRRAWSSEQYCSCIVHVRVNHASDISFVSLRTAPQADLTFVLVLGMLDCFHSTKQAEQLRAPTWVFSSKVYLLCTGFDSTSGP